MLQGKKVMVPMQIDYMQMLQQFCEPRLLISTYNLSPSIGRAIVTNDLYVGVSGCNLGDIIVLEQVTFVHSDTRGKLYTTSDTRIVGEKPASVVHIQMELHDLYETAQRLLSIQQSKKNAAYYNK
jgi:hypothetical protein